MGEKKGRQASLSLVTGRSLPALETRRHCNQARKDRSQGHDRHTLQLAVGGRGSAAWLKVERVCVCVEKGEREIEGEDLERVYVC